MIIGLIAFQKNHRNHYNLFKSRSKSCFFGLLKDYKQTLSTNIGNFIYFSIEKRDKSELPRLSKGGIHSYTNSP